MILFPFQARAEIARLRAENEELRRKLSAGGKAANEKARKRVAATTERLRAELNI